jgi:hypothetical protein
MKSPNQITRRSFLKNATAIGTMSLSAPAVLGAKSPNEKIQVGCIGIGVRGGSLVEYLARLKSAKTANPRGAAAIANESTRLSFSTKLKTLTKQRQQPNKRNPKSTPAN